MKYNDIKGLGGRQPIAAVVSVGKKNKKGFPEQKDRYHIVVPREADGVRIHHPAFMPFNQAEAFRRKSIRGNLVHATQDEAFEFYLKAMVLNKMHPNKKSACEGDGVKATRWIGPGPDDYQDIKCSNELCEFRKATPPKCKPFMRMLFRIELKEFNLPTPLVKFTSGSWNSVANAKGFFEHLHRVANQLGLKEYSLFGMPFIMTLIEQTKSSARSRFPVTTFSSEAEPVEFFMAQRAKIKQLTGEVPLAITDNTEQSPDVVFEDFKGISVPSQIPENETIIELETTSVLQETPISGQVETVDDPQTIKDAKSKLWNDLKSIHLGDKKTLIQWLRDKAILEKDEILGELSVERLGIVNDQALIAKAGQEGVN